MADLSITSTAVLPGTDAVIERGLANAAASAGDLAYYDSATGQYGKHDADSVTAAIRTLRGMFVDSPGAAGAACCVQTKGDVTVGAVLTQGKIYIGSATAGKVAPVADQASGMYANIIGIAKTASVLTINVVNGPAAQ
jgi:hypothetical protein